MPKNGDKAGVQVGNRAAEAAGSLIVRLFLRKRELPRALSDPRIHTHSRVKAPSFFPECLGLSGPAGVRGEQRQATNRIGQIQLWRFLIAEIQSQSFAIQWLGRFGASFVLENIRHVPDGMREFERIVSLAVNGSRFLIVTKGFVCVMQVAFYLAQCRQSLGEPGSIIGRSGERDCFSQVALSISRAFESRVTGLYQQFVDRVCHGN
jgi:hypothetical protein